MDLRKIFASIGMQMLTDFDSFHSQINYPGGKGIERELGLINFLEAYLPSRYSVSSGEIVDTTKQVSKQCDIVIYDQQKCPLLLAGKNFRIFPSEPVFAVIEVKSVLSKNELDDAIANIKSIKDLNRENKQILGIIFAYRSSWKKDVIQQLSKHIQTTNNKLSPRHYVDLVCVLDSGLIQLHKDDDEYTLLSHYKLEVPVLLWFFVQLLHMLDLQQSESPNYQHYLNDGEIGLVSFHDAQEGSKDTELN